MMTFTTKSTSMVRDEVTLVVALNYDQRQKSRLKTSSQCGKELGIILERGAQLFDGDILVNANGDAIRILAEQEVVTKVSALEPSDLVRAAYHLGNRHVPVQISPTYLLIKHDHVLEDMLVGLGFVVEPAQQAFQPESGAYSTSQAKHSHSHHHHHEH